MKIRRITIEVEVPFEYDGAWLLARLAVGVAEGVNEVPYQAQVMNEEHSTNTQIGTTVSVPLDPMRARYFRQKLPPTS